MSGYSKETLIAVAVELGVEPSIARLAMESLDIKALSTLMARLRSEEIRPRLYKALNAFDPYDEFATVLQDDIVALADHDEERA